MKTHEWRGPNQPEGTVPPPSGSHCRDHGGYVGAEAPKVPCLPARVLSSLAHPMTTDELTRELCTFSKPVREAVDKLHRRSQIHIEDWDTTGGQPRARWVAGPGQDAPRPRRVWAAEKEIG